MCFFLDIAFFNLNPLSQEVKKIVHFRCGECLVGASGDPSSVDGCVPCHCNGHGEASKGLCKPDTGHCFCTDHTEGPNCATCRRGFYGDPRDGGSCFRGCAPRALLSGLGPGSLGAADARPLDECLWVGLLFSLKISANAKVATKIFNYRIKNVKKSSNFVKLCNIFWFFR